MITILSFEKEVYDGFTKKQQAIAEYIKNKPADVCYLTLAEISKKIGCSELTIIKFCKVAGFKNFLSLKKHFRDHQVQMVNTFSASTLQVEPSFGENMNISFIKKQCKDEMSSISDFYNSVNFDSILETAKSITTKKVIYIFGHDVSLIFASFLKSRLDIMNMNTVLVDLSNIKKSENVFKNMDDKDIAIFFSFPNYFYSSGEVARIVKEKNCEILLITNSKESPVMDYADDILLCETKTKVFNNSWILPVSAINLLTACISTYIK